MPYFNRVLVGGWGSIQSVGQVARSLGKRVCLVVGKGFAKRVGYVDRISSVLRDEGLEVRVYEGVEPNPSVARCDDLGARIREWGCDAVIAFGGGSVIDAAKAGAAVAKSGRSVETMFYPSIVEEAIPIVAIPTTCGTGSEVTRYAVITTRDGMKKLTMVGDAVVPYAAILDPEPLTYLPKHLLAYTAMDALSHAIEAYTSRKCGALCEESALSAAKLVVENLLCAYEGVGVCLERLQVAAYLAGIAINFAGTNVVHAASYYLTTRHGVHHGHACAVMLPHAITHLLRALPMARVERLMNALGCRDAECVRERIVDLERRVGIEPSLRSVGVEEWEIDNFVDDVMSYRRNLENAPMDVTRDLVRSIITSALRPP